MHIFMLLLFILNHFVKSENISSQSSSTPINVLEKSVIQNATISAVHHSSREGVKNPPIFMEGEVAPFNNTEYPNLKINKTISLPIDDKEQKSSLKPIDGADVSKSSTQARKGAQLDINLVSDVNANSTNKSINITEIFKINEDSSNSTKDTKEASNKSTQTLPNTNSSIITNSTQKIVHKKPTITVSSSEAHLDSNIQPPLKEVLQNSSVSNNQQNGAKPPKTSNILLLEQTSDDSTVGINYHYPQEKVNVSRNQPGYIIPLVITVLAVPLLALIGYQAVRRGREAWKNRHYKRMDFLIDGMYND